MVHRKDRQKFKLAGYLNQAMDRILM